MPHAQGLEDHLQKSATPTTVYFLLIGEYSSDDILLLVNPMCNLLPSDYFTLHDSTAALSQIFGLIIE